MCFLNLCSLLPHLYTYIFCAFSFFPLCFFPFIPFIRPFDEFVAHFWRFLVVYCCNSGAFFSLSIYFFFQFLLAVVVRKVIQYSLHTVDTHTYIANFQNECIFNLIPCHSGVASYAMLCYAMFVSAHIFINRDDILIGFWPITIL